MCDVAVWGFYIELRQNTKKPLKVSAGWVSKQLATAQRKTTITKAAASQPVTKVIQPTTNREVGNSCHAERRTDLQGADDVRHSDIWPNNNISELLEGKNQKGCPKEELRKFVDVKQPLR